MVMIEPAPSEEERNAVNVTPKLKPKPSKAVATESSSSHDATSAAGDVSDGFETASESDFNGSDEQQQQQQEQQQQPQQQSVSPKDDSLKATSNDDESIQKALVEANDAKLDGNRLFGDGQYEEALVRYEAALQVAPEMPSSVEIHSICHANRAICFFKLGKNEDTIKECTKALELNPNYVKALRRRGEAHEKLEHFEEAIADMKKILELDESDVQARRTIQRLEPLAAEKREKMKQEMIDKLKDMGNSVLGRFGMSIDNFKAVQDPNTGSYSISFQR
ncbi:Tetratricopeptide repeat protein 1 [Camellia lanceoleosa]|uniref:Tetratricopeptide repeat protein 1 n=1 Tax=Camellia lanceoleosa TaxID=1840588 RepID=A0ACC0GDY7_9ERIC|nr:Tetratricopeptide repeat protein 1 [Camellia lanceoleosa]